MLREAFAKSAKANSAGERLDFIEAVLRERPDLRGQPVFFPEQGQKGHVAIIGNEVFKAPRRITGECMDDFLTECRVLEELKGKGLPVPEITTVGRDFHFIGMTRAPGVLMGDDFEYNLTERQQRRLAADLAGFIVAMARALPAPEGTFAMHDDLWYNNIFVDPATGRLSGVIDFGKVVCKKPDDWAPMFDFEGMAFYDMLQKAFNSRKAELAAGATASARPEASAFSPRRRFSA